MHPRKIAILTLFLALACTLAAQRNPQPYFRNYGTEDGLPSPEVYCAFEDSKGLMWFGTDNGAARFDGYEFKTYGPDEGLMSNVVFDIYEDGRGRIWFGTMTGEVFILEGDSVVPYEYNQLVEQYRGQFRMAGLVHLSEDETAILALVNLGFLKIDKNGKSELLRGEYPSSVLIVHEKGFQETLVEPVQRADIENYLQWQTEQEDKMLWPIEVHLPNLSFQKKLPRYKKLAWGHETQLLPNGELLVQGTGYLHCLQDSQLLWSVPFELGITEIIPDKNGSIWLCLTGNNGLRRYKDLESLKNGVYEQFLNGLSISKIVQDSKQNYWVTSQEKGIFFLPDFDLVTYDMQSGLTDNFINSVAFKNGNELFVGQNNGEIFRIVVDKNDIKKFGEGSFVSHNLSLLFDATKDVLYGGGYFYKNERKDFFIWKHPISGRIQPFATKGFDNLQFNSKGNLVGNLGYSGFQVLDTENNLVVFAGPYVGVKMSTKRIYGLHSDHSDRLWLGLANGLVWFNFTDSTYIPAGPTHPAFHHRVEDIDEMADSTLVFGTKGYGVIFWKGDSVLQVSTADGLTSAMLEDVHIDENGTCWAGTLNGLNKITFDKTGRPVVRTFTVHNGLPSNEIYQIKSYEGQAWLCTAGGLVKFHERPENNESPAPILQWVKVNGKGAEETANAAFRHSDNNFEFRFLAINYRMDGRIPYRYRLQRDADWVYTQNLTANYPALQPDEYAFEVQAQNEDGYWSSSMTYTFAVLPPWYATWWFRGLAAAALAAAGFGFYKYRTTQLKRENALQRQMTELEKSALQAQMNPHFIFNCLNSIQNFILKNDQKKAVQYLARFAKLVRHNLEASIRGSVSLEEEVNMLDNYLALEQERHNRAFDYDITVADELRDDFIEFPSMLIQPFVENAVLHGMAGKTGGGKVDIHFSRSNGQVQVTVRDNGGGFRQDGAEEKTPRHNSAGMSITQKRLELLGADTSDAIQIKQATNGNGEVTGTEVNVFIHTKTT